MKQRLKRYITAALILPMLAAAPPAASAAPGALATSAAPVITDVPTKTATLETPVAPAETSATNEQAAAPAGGARSAAAVRHVSSASGGGADAEVSFYSNENGDIKISVQYTGEAFGKTVFLLYNNLSRLCGAAVMNTDRNGNEYIFSDCDDSAYIKVIFCGGEEKNISPDRTITVSVREIKGERAFLRVGEGGLIKTAYGETIQLRGVNFGGWLLQETWMCPVFAFNGSVTTENGENGWGNLDTLDELERRFGTEEAERLMKSYRDSYITEWDFKNVRALGFNCIRIPFWYRNFMSDEDGTYITENDDENPGFIKLDWACDMADKYGLYLIFDMHGCPGGQNGDHSSGRMGRNFLFKETKYQDIMEDLWVKIAARYKDRQCIAAYDIMNEPFNNADTVHRVADKYIADPWEYGETNLLRVALYDRMIKAVRRADPYHIITVEGIWRLSFLPDPAEYGWDNIMYQLHSYDSGETETAELVSSLETYASRYNTAALMGEFNPAVFNKNIVSMMDEKGISYTAWTYKTAMPFEDISWGLYHRNYTDAEMKEICEDAYDEVISSRGKGFCSLDNLSDEQIKNLYTRWWTEENLLTRSFRLNTEFYNCLRRD